MECILSDHNNSILKEISGVEQHQTRAGNLKILHQFENYFLQNLQNDLQLSEAEFQLSTHFCSRVVNLTEFDFLQNDP